MAPAAPAVTPPPAPAPVAAVGWDAAVGAALVVPAPSGEAMLVLPGAPDSAGVDTARGAAAPALPAEAVLLAPGGMVGQARVTSAGSAGTARCAGWPRVRLGPASGADAVPAWTVGLVPGSGAAPAILPLDSLDEQAGADSAALAAALTRLAAGLPEAAGVRAATRAALRGVPFRVKRVRGFAPDSATRAVVAALTRTVNQEASPAADVLLLVAERPAAAGADAWRAAYAERVTGPEETLPSTAVLAAVRLGAAPGRAHAALVTAREADDGTRYGLLERVAPGTWRARWTSARVGAGCAR